MEFGEVIKTLFNSEYSTVYRFVCKRTGETKVLKRVKWGEYADREIEALAQMKRHKNVVEMLDHQTSNDQVFIILENCQTDLYHIIKSRKYQISDIRGIMRQIFKGLAYIHDLGYIHRDIKPENVLVTEGGLLKIADFGLVREIESMRPATPQMVTIYYRSIEILLATTKHTTGIDIWAAGCVFAELLQYGKVLFEGSSEIDMLNKVITILGTPTVENWPELETLPAMENIILRHQPENQLKKYVENADDVALEVMKLAFCFDPEKRLSAHEAVDLLKKKKNS